MSEILHEIAGNKSFFPLFMTKMSLFRVYLKQGLNFLYNGI